MKGIQPRPRFTDRDLLTDLVLGIHGAEQRLHTLLNTLAPQSAGETERIPRPSAPIDAELALLLGLLSVCGQIERLFPLANAPPPMGESSSAPPLSWWR